MFVEALVLKICTGDDVDPITELSKHALGQLNLRGGRRIDMERKFETFHVESKEGKAALAYIGNRPIPGTQLRT
jgi:hypothetical protein